MPDERVTTWKSKQVGFDHNVMLDNTLGETDNYIICISPQSVWLLRTMLAMYGHFYNRWSGFAKDDIDQLVSLTERSLIVPLGCETDLTRIADALEAMLDLQIDQNLFLQQFEAINSHLADLNGNLVDIKNGQLNEGLFDDIEETLDDIGTVLGIVGTVIG